MRRQGAELNQVAQMARSDDELADVQRPVLASDIRDDDVQPTAVCEQRVNERRGEVEPAARRLEHALDEVPYGLRREQRRCQLGPAMAGDEDPTWLVHPDLLDRFVVEIALQRPETRDGVEDLLRHARCVLERWDGPAETSFVVRPDRLVDQTADRIEVSRGVQTPPTHRVAHLRVDQLESCHLAPPRDRPLTSDRLLVPDMGTCGDADEPTV